MSKDARAFLTLPPQTQQFAYGMLTPVLKKEVDDLRAAKSFLDLPPENQRFAHGMLSPSIQEILKEHGNVFKGVSRNGVADLKLPPELGPRISQFIHPFMKSGSRKRKRRRFTRRTICTR